MVRELACEVSVQLVPARQVVNQHYRRKRPNAQRPREVGVDGIPVITGNRDSLRYHPFILVGRIVMWHRCASLCKCKLMLMSYGSQSRQVGSATMVMPNQIWRKCLANPSHPRAARQNDLAAININTVSVVANISNCIN